jgi:salicylate hydroxylase
MNIMLRHPEIEVQVYEGAQKFEEIGAGLGVWKRIANILEELGLGDDFQKAATWPPKGREGQ